jgi:hypothetical protein
MVVPSRGRPHAIEPLFEDWRSNTDRADLLIAVDRDDPELFEYARVCSRNDIWVTVGPRLGMAGTLNRVAVDLSGEECAIGFMGDDHRTRTPGWDVMFLKVLERPGPQIVYGNDLLQGEKMCTAVVMTSDIIRTLGYMSPPVLRHLCLDLTWMAWGKGLNRLTYFDDVIIEHLHPIAGKAALDAGYVRVNSPQTTAADHAAFYAYLESGLEDDLEKLRGLL